MRIETLDNPGWTIEIDLTGTELDDITVPKRSTERSEQDWISYEVVDHKFCAHGGPSSLAELITAFRRIWEEQRH